MKRALATAALLATGAVALLPAHGSAATVTTTDWKHLSPATSPTSRYYIRNMMAYDAFTSQLILFGGFGIGPSNETWLWNGTTWTLLSPATSPPARAGGSLAYDPSTHQLVLTGGKGFGGALSDTWNWTGTTWVDLAPATTPPQRAGAMLGYDATTSKLVLFGGADLTPAPSFRNDSWAWDGTDWTSVATVPANTPSARWASGIAADSTSGQLLLFGGQGGTGALADTWVWNGTGWTDISPATTSPSTRSGPAMADDPLLGGLVLFGGLHNGTSQNDTWTWNGTAWAPLTTATTPPARDTGSLAYDAASSQLILFGGETLTVGAGGGSILGDTWDLATITTTTPTGIPVPAAGAGLPLLAIILVALGGAVLVGTKRIGTRRAAG